MFHGPVPSYHTSFINLPLARLHVLETGTGMPLIMVPATISELENWRSLAQFMAHWFHVYFFELPGHGGSEPFLERFSSQLVAGLVTQLVDALGCPRFNLIGFSFGGILAMRTFRVLSSRIDRLLLLAPCLSYRALPYSASRLSLLRQLNEFFGSPRLQDLLVGLFHDPRTASATAHILQKIGRLEDSIPLREKLLRIRVSTVAVLNAQIREILTTGFETAPTRYETPCYFAMSIHDPMLDFDTTERIMHEHFENISTLRLTYPFHQPPVPFTWEELTRDYYETVDSFVLSEAPIPVGSA